jgi:hypothetical protein
MLHVLVVNDYHQALISSKMYLMFITGLFVAMDPLLLVLSCRSFLRGITTFKYKEVFI